MSNTSRPRSTGGTASWSKRQRATMDSSRFPSSPSTPASSHLPPLSSPRVPPMPCPRVPPLPSPRSSLPSFASPQASTPPWSPHPTSLAPTSSQPAPAPQAPQELITLAPLLSDKPLPRPTHTSLPSIREVFPVFPPELPPPPPPQNPIPDISNLFVHLLPRNKQQPPLSDNVGDDTVRVQVCATCRNPDPTMACPRCHLIHYCSSTTCLLQDISHPATCTRYSNIAATVYAQPYNHRVRLELVEILEGMFKRQRTRHLLHMAIWHRNEIIRLSQNTDPVRINLEFPFNLLRTGENDAVVSFVQHWARKTSRMISDTDRYMRSIPGDRTYPVKLDRYEDALEENFPRGAVPLTHLVALCLVKIRILASCNARVADGRQRALWASNFGKRLSESAGARLEDFLLRGGRSKDIGDRQVSLLTKYLMLVRERNPIMEYVIKDARLLHNGPPNGYEASYGEAKDIWDAIGDLFVQLPGYPRCVF